MVSYSLSAFLQHDPVCVKAEYRSPSGCDFSTVVKMLKNTNIILVLSRYGWLLPHRFFILLVLVGERFWFMAATISLTIIVSCKCTRNVSILDSCLSPHGMTPNDNIICLLVMPLLSAVSTVVPASLLGLSCSVFWALYLIS